MTHTATPQCVFCSAPYSRARLDELGYMHCPADLCVAKWRKHKLETEFRLDLVPKVGFAITHRTDPTMVTAGRSSGRSV
jgi:hypothetical protein